MNNKCEVCGDETVIIGAVVNGKYYRCICHKCLSKSRQISSGHADWQRGRDLEDHLFELLQPYNADGTRNADFIKAYPTQASAIFTKKEMDDTLRV